MDLALNDNKLLVEMIGMLKMVTYDFINTSTIYITIRDEVKTWSNFGLKQHILEVDTTLKNAQEELKNFDKEIEELRNETNETIVKLKVQSISKRIQLTSERFSKCADDGDTLRKTCNSFRERVSTFIDTAKSLVSKYAPQTEKLMKMLKNLGFGLALVVGAATVGAIVLGPAALAIGGAMTAVEAFGCYAGLAGYVGTGVLIEKYGPSFGRSVANYTQAAANLANGLAEACGLCKALEYCSNWLMSSAFHFRELVVQFSSVNITLDQISANSASFVSDKDLRDYYCNQLKAELSKMDQKCLALSGSTKNLLTNY